MDAHTEDDVIINMNEDDSLLSPIDSPFSLIDSPLSPIDQPLSTIDPPLSPIVEMDESSIFGSMEGQGEDLYADSEEVLKNKSLILDTTAENLEDRLSQPETPPEVLRVRLNSLQNDFEELKEFTELEKQIYHSDCIPREKVRSLEDDFASLNEKVQHLMYENSEYKRKLEMEEKEKSKLESELAKALILQNESTILIGSMKQKMKDNIKDYSTENENDLFPYFSFLGKCGENAEVLHAQTMKPFLNSLKSLDDMLNVILHDKKTLLDQIDDLQLEVFDLNESAERMKEKVAEYEQILTSVKSSSCNLQDKELTDITLTLSVSENKLIEAETIKDVLSNENCKLLSEMDRVQKEVISIINTLKSVVHSLNDNPDIMKDYLTHEELTALENNLINSSDLFTVSSTVSILVKIFHKLKTELKIKCNECYELQVKTNNDQTMIKQLNDHVRKFEEEAYENKIEMQFLKVEITHRIPSRLAELQNILGCKESENLRLENNLEATNTKINELSIKLAVTQIEMDQIKVSLHKKSLEKTSLENEILKLKDRFTIDDIQTHIILAIKHLEQIINSWDENTNLGDFINVLQENEDIVNLIKSLMNIQTRSFFIDVVQKFKKKLLLYEKEKYNQCSMFKKFEVTIDHLEIENIKLRSELNALDHIVKEGISNKVNDLEKLLGFQDQKITAHESKPYLYSEGKYSQLILEEDKQREDVNLLEAHKNGCDKLQKEINNFNKATKSDDDLKKIIFDLNEIENVIDSWTSLEKIQVSEFTKHLNDKIHKYFDNDQSSNLKVDVLRIVDKFEMKLVELNNQLLQTIQLMSNRVKDYENKQDISKNTIEDLECKNNRLKENNMLENVNLEKMLNSEMEKQIKTMKKLMVLEITSLDETENGNSLMYDSLENIFSKLMQIIIKKQQEMSYSIQKQQKEEIHNFEQTIEKMNNKLKSQESWIEALNNENENINTELSTVKSLNNSFDYKLIALTKDINNKNLEIHNIKSKILELTIENDSIISDLDKTKDLINTYKHSVSSLEKDNDKLNQVVINKSNIIKHLELKLNSDFKKQDNLDRELSVSSSELLPTNAKGDHIMVEVNQINVCESNNVIIENCSDLVTNKKENISDFESRLLEMLRMESAFINNMLIKGESNVLSDNLSICHEKLHLLKDVIQTIGSKISELEMRHIDDLQSIQTTLECKNKEMHDLKLSISKLYWDLVPDKFQMRKGEMSDDSFQQYSLRSIKSEFDQIKSERVSLHNGSEELEQSAKVGQSIIQSLRETFQIIVDENHSTMELFQDLQKSVEFEKQSANKIAKEKNMLIAKISLLENEISYLKLEFSQIGREIFSEIDISFPDELQNKEKVAYINNILKVYSENQKVYYTVTDDLTFFCYQCELMLPYIQSLEFKLFFGVQRNEHLEKENTTLKKQLSSQNLEMNRFINQLVSKSPFAIKSLNQALEVICHIFSEYKLLKENKVKYVNEDKCKQDKILQQQQELTLLTKHNSSLKFELTKCEDSIRNLRSEVRTVRLKHQRRESHSFECTEVKQAKMDIAVQTENTCCERLQKKVIELKENIDIMSEKLTRNEQHQQPSQTSNPYNKQVTYLEGALGQAKERMKRIYFELKRQESYNQELVEAIKRQEGVQERLDKANKEIEKLKSGK